MTLHLHPSACILYLLTARLLHRILKITKRTSPSRGSQPTTSPFFRSELQCPNSPSIFYLPPSQTSSPSKISSSNVPMSQSKQAYIPTKHTIQKYIFSNAPNVPEQANIYSSETRHSESSCRKCPDVPVRTATTLQTSKHSYSAKGYTRTRLDHRFSQQFQNFSKGILATLYDCICYHVSCGVLHYMNYESEGHIHDNRQY